MWCLKCCPRCDTGALYEGTDMYGSYIACLQCGSYLTEAQEVALGYETGHGPEPSAKKEPLAAPIFVGAAR